MLDNYQRVESVLAAFAAGEIVVVTDDDDRENEGDLFVAASLCTPEKMAFIIRHTSGIVCAPLSAEEAKRLHLDPMVAANDAPLGTAFTVSVDVRHGLTTGISGEERTNTVRALANGNAGASDFVRPGHVFPLVAKDGGVLMRSGHTEACVDLCRLAGLAPVGVLAELMNDDGTVMRGPGVTAFAERHKLQADFDRRYHRVPADAGQTRQAHRRIPGAEQDRDACRLCLCDAVRRHPAHGLRLRPHRRRQGHAGAAASRRYHPRCLRRRQSGPLRSGAVQAGRPRRHRVPSRRCRRSADPCHPAVGLDRFRGCALAAMARGRARRPDSQGSGHHLDPAADIGQAHLCRSRRLRYRDQRRPN